MPTDWRCNSQKKAEGFYSISLLTLLDWLSGPFEYALAPGIN
jgi:hypothetical protein